MRLTGNLVALVGTYLTTDALAHGMSESDKLRILNADLADYAELGAIHMLTGYDLTCAPRLPRS